MGCDWSFVEVWIGDLGSITISKQAAFCVEAYAGLMVGLSVGFVIVEISGC